MSDQQQRALPDLGSAPASRVALDWKGLGAVVLWEAGVTRDDRGVVHLPYRLEDGSTWRTRCFAPIGRRWWGPPTDAPIIPFGLETIPPAEQAIDTILLIAEGESDCLALRETYAELDGLAVVVLGVPGATTWRSGWRRRIKWFREVYVVGDGDPAGRRFGERVVRDMPWAEPVLLPDGEDARSMIQSGRVEQLTAAIQQARETAAILEAIRHSPTLPEFHRWIGSDDGSA